MSDSITKQMMIALGMRDETGSAWDSFKSEIDAAKEWITPLNQAWELSAKLWDKIGAAASAAIGVLSDGGQFNEVSAAFDNLSARTGAGGDAMVRHLQEITSGVMGLEEAMQTASSSMTRGFSASQANSISAFAKKIEEATGESMGSVIDQIERAIITGQRLERLEMFGVHLEKGMSMQRMMGELDSATKRFGDGAFNFGDLWSGALQKVSDTMKILGRELNIIMGKDGLAKSAFDGFMAGMTSIQESAPALAAALWTPIRQIGQWLDILTGGVEDLGEKAVAAVGAVGNGLYSLMGAMGRVIDGFVSMSAKGTEFRKWYSGLIGDTADQEAAERELLWLESMATWADRIADARLEFNTAIISAHEKTQQSAEVMGSRIQIHGAQGPGKNVLFESGSGFVDNTRGYVSGGNKPGQFIQGDTSGAKMIETGVQKTVKVELVAPPGDTLFKAFVDYINQAAQKEGATGAGVR